MQIIGLKNCDTCRAALKAFSDTATLRDVRQEPLTEAEISKLYAQFGADLVNRRSTTWRGLSEADKARDPIELLRENPTLMKRPVIVVGARTYLGWGADVRAELLG